MNPPTTADRRTVLKTIGVGTLGGITLATSASAKEGDDTDKGNDYGNGNGIGAFLNEEAKWNDKPWGGGIANLTGESEVEISVGSLTTVNPPPALTGGAEEIQLPFGFAPQVAKVSPGTEVTWTWESPHHSVTSYNSSADDPDPHDHTHGDHGQLFDSHAHTLPHEMSYTFEERGTYLYFCYPHGTPYPAYDAFLESIPGVDPIQENLFGMRGAVLVAGKPD